MDYAVDPGHPRYVPELPLRLRKVLLPAMDYALNAFPESPGEQRAMMLETNRGNGRDDGRYRSAGVAERFPLSLGSLPAEVSIQVTTTHDITAPVTALNDAALQIRLELVFSTAILGGKDTISFDDFLFSKSVQRFFDDIARAAGLVEGRHNVMKPGEYSAASGACYGKEAHGRSLNIHNSDLPRLKAVIRREAVKLWHEIDLELEELPHL